MEIFAATVLITLRLPTEKLICHRTEILFIEFESFLAQSCYPLFFSLLFGVAD